MATTKTAAKAKEQTAVSTEEQKKGATTAVAVAQPNAVVTAPAFMEEADFHAGFENADSESYAIPFLQILQKMSPLVDEDSPKHIEGLKAGMVFNTVTQKAYDVREKPLQFVPCYFKRSFILWGARDAEGGFKGEVTPEHMEDIIAGKVDGVAVELVDGRYLVKDKDGKVNPKKSDYYADTRSHYVIAIDPDTGEFGSAILSLASTQIKASKMLLTMLQQKKIVHAGVKRTPPTFANVVSFTTVAQQNDKGSWAGAKFELTGMVTDPDLYASAKEFYRAIHAGEVQADYSKAAETGEPGSVDSKPKDAEGF